MGLERYQEQAPIWMSADMANGWAQGWNAAVEVFMEYLPKVRSYDRDGVPHEEILMTRTGKIITEEDIARWAEEAAGDPHE